MRIGVLACFALLALALPGAASAATTVSQFEDTIGFSNDGTAVFAGVTFNPVANKYRFDDDNADVDASGFGNCTQVATSPHKQVDCPNTGIFKLLVFLGEGSDLFSAQETI